MSVNLFNKNLMKELPEHVDKRARERYTQKDDFQTNHNKNQKNIYLQT